VVPIMYGLPGPEMTDASIKGEIVLGGCVISGHDPIWLCRECGVRWDGEGSTEDAETRGV
jgi:hypothetical protein